MNRRALTEAEQERRRRAVAVRLQAGAPLLAFDRWRITFECRHVVTKHLPAGARPGTHDHCPRCARVREIKRKELVAGATS